MSWPELNSVSHHHCFSKWIGTDGLRHSISDLAMGQVLQTQDTSGTDRWSAVPILALSLSGTHRETLSSLLVSIAQSGQGCWQPRPWACGAGDEFTLPPRFARIRQSCSEHSRTLSLVPHATFLCSESPSRLPLAFTNLFLL